MDYRRRIIEIKKRFGYDDGLYRTDQGFFADEFANAGNPDGEVIYISLNPHDYSPLPVFRQVSLEEDYALTENEADYLLSEVSTREEFETRLKSFAAIHAAVKQGENNGL